MTTNILIMVHAFEVLAELCTNQNKPMWKLAMQEHGQMLDAIVARDRCAARRVLVEHLLRKRDVVLDLMRSGAT